MPQPTVKAEMSRVASAGLCCQFRRVSTYSMGLRTKCGSDASLSPLHTLLNVRHLQPQDGWVPTAWGLGGCKVLGVSTHCQ